MKFLLLVAVLLACFTTVAECGLGAGSYVVRIDHVVHIQYIINLAEIMVYQGGTPVTTSSRVMSSNSTHSPVGHVLMETIQQCARPAPDPLMWISIFRSMRVLMRFMC